MCTQEHGVKCRLWSSLFSFKTRNEHRITPSLSSQRTCISHRLLDCWCHPRVFWRNAAFTRGAPASLEEFEVSRRAPAFRSLPGRDSMGLRAPTRHRPHHRAGWTARGEPGAQASVFPTHAVGQWRVHFYGISILGFGLGNSLYKGPASISPALVALTCTLIFLY